MADTKKKKVSTKSSEKAVKENKKSTEKVEKVVKKEEVKEVVSTEMVEKDKIEDSKVKKNASFVQRLGAYLLDVFLISIIASIFITPFTNTDNYEKLSKETDQVIEEYSEGKMDIETYVSRVSDISYDMSREVGLSSIITIAIYILYFIVYQYYNNGQTIGKRIMKIRVENVEEKELSMNMLLMRSLIINSILADLIILTITILGNRESYFIGVGIFEGIQYLILFVIAMMVLSRKDKRGLHDMICHTKVVNVEV